MKLNAAEKKWLSDLQAVLDACPSDRLGFYTIGDPSVSVYDRRKEKQINALMDAKDNLDFPGAVYEAKGETDVDIRFPQCVHSVAG